MPVDLVAGTMGGGKSYYVAEQCIKAWKEGAHVISNLDFYPEEIERRGWKDRWIDMRGRPIHEWMESIVKGVEGCENVVAVDEAGMELNAMDQADHKKHNRTLFNFLAYSRKMGLEVYFICQHHANLDVGLRKMMRQTMWCVNVEKQIPFWGPLFSIFFDFKRTILNHKNTALGTTWAKRSKEVDTIYDTFGAAGHSAEIKRHVTRRKKKKWGRWVALALVLALAWVIVYGYKHMIFGGMWAIDHFSKNEKKNGTPKTEMFPAPVGQAGPVKPTVIPYTEKKLLAAFKQAGTTRLWLEGKEVVQLGQNWRGSKVLAITGTTENGYTIFQAGAKTFVRCYTNAEKAERRKELWEHKQHSPSLAFGRADSSLLGSLARGFGQLTQPQIRSAETQTEQETP